MKEYVNFSVFSDDRGCSCGSVIGVEVGTIAEVRELAALFGAAPTPRSLRIEDVPADSPELARLLEAIKTRYGLIPSPHRVAPHALMGSQFDMMRYRKYTDSDLNGCELLWCRGTKPIADHIYGNDNDGTPFSARKQRAARIGFPIPFGDVLFVAEPLKSALEKEALAGLEFSEVAGIKAWRLGSPVILPRSGTLIQDGLGNRVDADGWTPGNELHRDSVGGEFSLPRAAVAELPHFDVAFTYERIGNGIAIAFRSVVVSQHFRQTMLRLGQKNLEYFPVPLV